MILLCWIFDSGTLTCWVLGSTERAAQSCLGTPLNNPAVKFSLSSRSCSWWSQILQLLFSPRNYPTAVMMESGLDDDRPLLYNIYQPSPSSCTTTSSSGDDLSNFLLLYWKYTRVIYDKSMEKEKLFLTSRLPANWT